VFWAGKWVVLQFSWMGHSGRICHCCNNGESTAFGPVAFESVLFVYCAVLAGFTFLSWFITWHIFSSGYFFSSSHVQNSQSWVEFSFILHLGKPTLLSRQTLYRWLGGTVKGWNLLGVTCLSSSWNLRRWKVETRVVGRVDMWKAKRLYERVSDAAMCMVGCRWDSQERWGLWFGGLGHLFPSSLWLSYSSAGSELLGLLFFFSQEEPQREFLGTILIFKSGLLIENS